MKINTQHTGVLGVTSARRGGTAPDSITWSLRLGPSPAMFPRAQTACSATLACWDDSSFTNGPTALAFTTARVCSEVPDATFVMAQVASNWSSGLKHKTRSSVQFSSSSYCLCTNQVLKWLKFKLFSNPIKIRVSTQCYNSAIRFGLCCLMTPGVNQDIRCHVWPYFSYKLANQVRHQATLKVGCQPGDLHMFNFNLPSGFV